MKKTIFIGLFLTLLVVPSITQAAWYNPFSWFKKRMPVPVVVQKVEPIAPVVVEEKPITKEIVKQAPPKPVQKVAPKPIEPVPVITQQVVTPIQPVIVPTPVIQQPLIPKEDPAIKIVRCQSESSIKKNDLLAQGDKMAENVVNSKIEEFEAQIKQLQIQALNAQKDIADNPNLAAKDKFIAPYCGENCTESVSLYQGAYNSYLPAINYDKAAIADWQNRLQAMKQGNREIAEKYYYKIYNECLSR